MIGINLVLLPQLVSVLYELCTDFTDSYVFQAGCACAFASAFACACFGMLRQPAAYQFDAHCKCAVTAK